MLKKLLTIIISTFLIMIGFGLGFEGNTVYAISEEEINANVCNEDSDEYDQEACMIISKEINNEITDIMAQITAAKDDLAQAQKLATEYEKQAESMQAEIDELTARIEELKIRIEELEVQIAYNENEVSELNDRVTSRMENAQKTMHFSGYLDFICGSTSFSDFLSRIYGVNALLSKDKDDRTKLVNLLNQLNADKQELSDSKAELDESYTSLVSKQGELLVMKEFYEEVAYETQLQLDELNNNLDTLFDLSDLVENVKNIQSSSGFVPAVHNSYISSGFPYRDTDFNYGQIHLGIDYAAAYGEEVHAPANGICIFAYDGCNGWGYYGSRCGAGDTGGLYGAGNQIYLICQVDSKVYGFILMHLSRIDIERGDVIFQDEVIGAVGSSGSSTGPHAHIEMYYLGEGNIADYMDIDYDGTFLCGRGSTALKHQCSEGADAPCILNPSYYIS